MASEEVAAGYVSLYARMDAASVASAIGGGISSSLGDIQGLLGGISSFTQGLGATLTVAGAVAARGISELAGSIVDAVSIAENASITFETLGRTVMGLDDIGASQFSNDFIELLNRFAIKTPYEFSGLITGARQLMAMGFTADQIISSTDGAFEGILNSAGNAAAALGLTDQGFRNVLLQIGHINAAGKPMAYNINALARNGINAWQMLADYMTEETGIETSIMDARAAVRAGEVDSETMLNALMKGFDQFEGQMDKMAHTFTGVMSNITDAMMVPIMGLRDAKGYRGMTDALYGMIDPLKELMYSIAPVIDEMMGRVGGGIEWLTGVVKNLTAAINNTDPARIVDTFQTIGGVLLSGPFLLVFGKFVGLAGKLAGIGKKLTGAAFGGIASGFGALSSSLSKLAKNKNIVATIQNIGNAIPNMLGQLIYGKNNWPFVAKRFETYIPAMLGGVLTAFSNTDFGGMFINVASMIAGPLKSVMPVIKIAAKAIGTEFSVAAKLATKAYAVFSRTMLTAGVGFGVVALGVTAAIAAYTAFGGNLRDVGSAIQGTLRTSAHVISTFLENATEGMRNAIDDGSLLSMFDAIGAGLVMFGNTVGAVLPDFADAFKDVAKAVVGRLVDTIADGAPKMVEGAIRLFTGILTGLTYVVELISAKLPTLIPQIVGAIVNNAPALIDAGIALATTLADALVDNIPAILSGAQEIVYMLADEISNNAPEMATAAYNLFMGFLDVLPDIWATIVQAVGSVALSIADSISENPEAVTSAIEEMIQTAIENLPGFVIQTNKLALGIITALCEAIKAIGPTLVRDAVMAAINEAMSNPLTSNAFNLSHVFNVAENGADFDSSQFDAIGTVLSGLGGLFATSSLAKSGPIVDTRRLVPDSTASEMRARIGAVNNAASTAIEMMGVRGAEQSLDAGKTIVYGFADGVGDSTQVKSMATQTGNVPASTIKAMPTAPLTSAGVGMSTAFASGIGSSAAKATAAAGASSLANSAVKSMSAGKSSAFLWGYELGNNFANGIKSAYSKVSSAANSLAKAAAGPLKHSTPNEGPLSDDDLWGYHMAQNFEQGMLKGVSLVERGSLALANAVSNPFTIDPFSTIGNQYTSIGGAYGTASIVDELAYALSKYMRPVVNVNGRNVTDEDIENITYNYLNDLEMRGAM